jgi:hypothetical protein
VALLREIREDDRKVEDVCAGLSGGEAALFMCNKKPWLL